MTPSHTRSPLESKLRARFVALGLLVFSIVMALVLGFLNFSQRQLMHAAQAERLDRIIANGGFYPEDDPSTLDPEAAYRARYFSVFYLGPDQPLLIRTRRVVALDEPTILDIAESVLQAETTEGTIAGYRYKHSTYGRGYLMVFLDTRQDTLALHQMLSLSLVIFGVLFLIIALLLYLFSGRAVRPFVDSVQKQQQFITDASHELRTPLAALRANLEVLEMLHGPDEWSQSSHAQIDRLSTRLDQLLNLSRVSESSAPTPRATIELIQWARTQLAAVEPLFKQRAITVTLDVSETPQPWTGPVDTLTKIASALLDNAAQYTPQGTWFTLSLDPHPTKPLLHFKNPADITPEDAARLFERFFRADHTHQRTDQGSGIGLSIVKALADREGFAITANTQTPGVIDFQLKLK